MPLYNIYDRSSGLKVSQEVSSSNNGACREHAKSIRSFYPQLSVDHIARKFKAVKVGKTSQGGRPRLYDF